MTPVAEFAFVTNPEFLAFNTSSDWLGRIFEEETAGVASGLLVGREGLPVEFHFESCVFFAMKAKHH